MNIDAGPVVRFPKYWFKASSARENRSARSAVMIWKDAYPLPAWWRKKIKIQARHAAAGKNGVRNHPARQITTAGEHKSFEELCK